MRRVEVKWTPEFLAELRAAFEVDHPHGLTDQVMLRWIAHEYVRKRKPMTESDDDVA